VELYDGKEIQDSLTQEHDYLFAELGVLFVLFLFVGSSVNWFAGYTVQDFI